MNDSIQKSTKGFFERPEGKTGMVVIVLAMVAGAYGLNMLLPILVGMMASMAALLGWTIVAGFAAAILTVMVMVVANPRFRTLFSYLFQSGMRKMTGMVIEMDPIGILRGYVEDLRKKLQSMAASIENLDKQIRKLKDVIERNKSASNNLMALGNEAHKQGKKNFSTLQSRKAGRLDKSNLTLQGLLNKMEGMRRIIQKMYETSDFMVQDMESEIDVKAREREAILATHSAFKSAKAIIAGDTDKKAVFDQAMEFLADDYSNRVGEVESFIQMSSSFIETVDLENGIYEQAALEKFEAWEKKADTLLLGPGDNNPLAAIDATPRRTPTAVASRNGTTEGSGSFSHLFDKD